jgi:hypothetical protein
MKICCLFFILWLFIISSGNSQTHKNYCHARLIAEPTYSLTKALLVSEKSKTFRQAETPKPLSEAKKKLNLLRTTKNYSNQGNALIQPGKCLKNFFLRDENLLIALRNLQSNHTRMQHNFK